MAFSPDKRSLCRDLLRFSWVMGEKDYFSRRRTEVFEPIRRGRDSARPKWRSEVSCQPCEKDVYRVQILSTIREACRIRSEHSKNKTISDLYRGKELATALDADFATGWILRGLAYIFDILNTEWSRNLEKMLASNHLTDEFKKILIVAVKGNSKQRIKAAIRLSDLYLQMSLTVRAAPSRPVGLYAVDTLCVNSVQCF